MAAASANDANVTTGNINACSVVACRNAAGIMQFGVLRGSPDASLMVPHHRMVRWKSSDYYEPPLWPCVGHPKATDWYFGRNWNSEGPWNPSGTSSGAPLHLPKG